MAAPGTALVPEVKFCKTCGCKMTRESVGVSAVNWEIREYCGRYCWMRRFQKPKPTGPDTEDLAQSHRCVTPGCDRVSHAEDRERGEFRCWACQENPGRAEELTRKTEGYSVPREMWGKVR